jgi:peptide/nickel transport system permease protein
MAGVARFIVRRLAIAIPLLIASSILSFVLVAASGDPLDELRIRQPPVPELIEQRTRDLNLDKTIPERYVIWVGDLLQGDLGNDKQGVPVGGQLWSALGITIRLLGSTLVLAVALALVVGTIQAVRQYSAFDYASTVFAFVCFSLPTFFLGVLLKEFLAIRFNDVLESLGFSRWISTIGHESRNFDGSFPERLLDWFGHMFLPAITLVLITFAAYSRYTRSSMLDVLSADYVRTARAKGVPKGRVIRSHALRNALIPVVTVVAIDFGAIVGGAVVTENVFQWDGMGKLLVTAISEIDVNLMQGWLLVTATMVIVGNLLADVVYAWLDPRIRLD